MPFSHFRHIQKSSLFISVKWRLSHEIESDFLHLEYLHLSFLSKNAVALDIENIIGLFDTEPERQNCHEEQTISLC